jgi:hypothetical protein
MTGHNPIICAKKRTNATKQNNCYPKATFGRRS